MSNKISPNTLRLGIFRRHDSEWFAKKDFSKFLEQDWKIRDLLMRKFSESARIIKILISRSKGVVEITVTCLYPSVIIGKKGGEINSIVSNLQKLLGCDVKIKIFDVKKPETNAKAIAMRIAEELRKKGAPCKRLIKKNVQLARNNVKGIKIECKGRLGGIEIARKDWYQDGSVPRQKLRANIDYACICSQAKWGSSCVKVWINKGDVIKKDEKTEKVGDKNVKS